MNNLIDLASVLSNAKNFEDKSLWTEIIQRIEAKFDRPAPKYVKYNGWNLDAYELDETKAAKQQFSTEVQRHLTEIRAGGKLSGNLKHEVRVVYDKLKKYLLV